MSRIEILAPAGSPESLRAAAACGADAVYLGIDVLNARRNAANFTRENLAETVQYCHIRGLKVYLTLNIILLEQELPMLVEVARAACEAGVDAAIVQDLGAAALLRRCCPGLRLNASTQMAVHNPEGARRLEQLGFSRVVLARECSRQEIEQIVRATSLEVEVFVHGALCMCVSGQCYLSSVLGQRSGNRGLCAQPCRLGFETRASSHALSLKDMSLIERIGELESLGVRSVKIEGRMKRPEYVAAAVTACRDALEGRPIDLEGLQSVFSRSGFTDGYYTGIRDLAMFGIRGKEDVTAAAGVLGRLETLYTDPRRQVQKVGIGLDFSMQAGGPSVLSVADCDGNTVRVEGESPQAALNKPTSPERAEASLSKTGGTPYRVERVSCAIGPGLMLPAAAINALRREALSRLDGLRGRARTVPFDPSGIELPAAPEAAVPSIPALRVRLNRKEQLSEPLWREAGLVTLPVPELVALFRAGQVPEPLVDRLCAGLPHILFEGQDTLRSQLAELREYGVRHAGAGNLGSLEIASGCGFVLHGEAFFNAANSETVAALARMGLADLELSFELSLDAARRLRHPLPLGLTAYGRLPLMTVRNCPVRVSAGCRRCGEGENFVTDRKGNRLYASCAYGMTELYNPVPLYMGDRLDELRGLGFYTLRFTTEDAVECQRVLDGYRTGDAYPGKFTRGLLYKTIL